MWSDGTPTDYWQWADGEPNDWRGAPGEEDPALPGEDCGLIWHRDDKLLTVSSFERQRGSWNDGECALPKGFVCETAPSTADSEGPNCVYQAQNTLGGFTMDEIYAPNSDNMIALELEPGMHIFQGSSEPMGLGWFGGYWEVVADGVSVGGGSSLGLVTGSMAFGIFTVPPAATSVMLNIHAGTSPEAISWMIDSPAEAGNGLLPAYSGPRAGIVTLGEDSENWPGYTGSFAGLSILRRPLQDDEAECLYTEGSDGLAVCEATDLLASERRTAFYGSFVDGSDIEGGGVSYGGDAYHDRNFGIQLDGDEDYISLERGQWYSNGQEFTISFWFSKTTTCSAASDSEMESLYSHQEANARRREWEDDNSNVNIQIGCASDGVGSSVQSAGADGRTDILRFWVQDDSNNKGVFDVGLDSARGGGWVTDQWIHLAFSVSQSRFEVYLDGLPARRYGFPTSWSDRGEDWAFSSANMAWNSAYSRDAPLGHNPFACVENGGADGDCCALAGEGSCLPGHVFSMGDPTNPCWTSRDGTRMAVSTYCVADGSVPPSPPPSRDAPQEDQYGDLVNSAALGLPKNSNFGRFANSGLYQSSTEYVHTVSLAIGEHTFTPTDRRGENWNGGTWWLVNPDDGSELVRGGVAEDLSTVNTVFTVPAASNTVAAFGPGCSRSERYYDFGVFRQIVTLEAGLYYFHSGGQLWDGASGNADLDQSPSYWTVYNNETGAMIAGGPGSGASRDDEGNEGIEMLQIPNTARLEVVITTYQTSGINWAITEELTLLGDGIRQCGGRDFELHIRTGISRPWDVLWELDGGNNPNGNDEDFSGPQIRPVYLGGLPRRDGGGWVGRDQYFEGSIAQVLLMTEAITPSEADCIFRSGEQNLGVCPSQEEMGTGRDWFGTFLGDSTNRIASRDLSGSRQSLSDEWTDPRTEAEATAACGAICAEQGYSYMGLQWANECWCDNDYGSKGTAEDATDGRGLCDIDDDGTPDCGQGIDGVCGWRNAVYAVDDTGALLDGTPVPGSAAAPAYLGCFADQITPKGTSLYGDATEDQIENFGVTLDGEGDYFTIDPQSQCKDRRYRACDDNYAADGSFTISFWFWKRTCAAPGAWEYLYSHQNNSAGIYNEPTAEASWRTIDTVINSEEERQRWILSDPELHGPDGSAIDLECRECFPDWRSLRGNYTAQLPFLQPNLPPQQVTNRDGSTGVYEVGYPMYLCLDNAGHDEMDVHRTVESFLRWKCSEGVTAACSWKTWRRPAAQTSATRASAPCSSSTTRSVRRATALSMATPRSRSRTTWSRTPTSTCSSAARSAAKHSSRSIGRRPAHGAGGRRVEPRRRLTGRLDECALGRLCH